MATLIQSTHVTRLTDSFKIRCENSDNLYVLNMWRASQPMDGRVTYLYSLYDGNAFIFNGHHFSAPASFGPLDCAMNLLGFLTLKPGDTDKDFFTDYTKKQLAWVQSADAEEISSMICDYED